MYGEHGELRGGLRLRSTTSHLNCDMGSSKEVPRSPRWRRAASRRGAVFCRTICLAQVESHVGSTWKSFAAGASGTARFSKSRPICGSLTAPKVVQIGLLAALEALPGRGKPGRHHPPRLRPWVALACQKPEGSGVGGGEVEHLPARCPCAPVWAQPRVSPRCGAWPAAPSRRFCAKVRSAPLGVIRECQSDFSSKRPDLSVVSKWLAPNLGRSPRPRGVAT